MKINILILGCLAVVLIFVIPGSSLAAKQGTCLDCHPEFEKLVTDGGLHTSEMRCDDCHLPHGKTGGIVLAAQPPKLCFLCHENTDNTHFNSKSDCMSCHAPHNSNKNLLKSVDGRALYESAPASLSIEDGSWGMKLSLSYFEIGLSDIPQHAAVFFDTKRDRYYVSDSVKNRLLAFDKEGNLLNIFKQKGAELMEPSSLVRDSRGVIWLVEQGRKSLTSINLAMKKIERHNYELSGEIFTPGRLAIAGQTIYMTDQVTGEIASLSEYSKLEKLIKCDTCVAGFADFVIHDDKIFALDQIGRAIYTYKINGSAVSKAAIPADVKMPIALEVDSFGVFYVLDRQSGNIVAFDQNGEISSRFLARQPDASSLNQPASLLFDPWGRLCFIDVKGGRVEVYGRVRDGESPVSIGTNHQVEHIERSMPGDFTVLP